MLALLVLGTAAAPSSRQVRAACEGSQEQCAQSIARALVGHARTCYKDGIETQYDECMRGYCADMCATPNGIDTACGNFCIDKAAALYPKLVVVQAGKDPRESKPLSRMSKSEVQAEARAAATEMNSAMDEMRVAQDREVAMAERLRKEAAAAGNTEEGRRKAATAEEMTSTLKAIDAHLGKIQRTMGLAAAMGSGGILPSFLQSRSSKTGQL